MIPDLTMKEPDEKSIIADIIKQPLSYFLLISDNLMDQLFSKNILSGY